MYTDSLYIQNMRNISSLTVPFVPGLNHIMGANGQGKTSILEAIQLLIVGSSFRTHQMKELVRSGSSELFVEGSIALDGVQRRISLGYDGTRRLVSMNGEVLPSSSLLFGTLLGVTSTPGDCEMIFGTPSERRRFIDEQIAQIDPVYVQQIRRLQRALQQRNTLLKQNETKGIEAWEDQIAKASGYICNERAVTVQKLTPHFHKYVDVMLDTEDHTDIEIKYMPSVPAIQALFQEEGSQEKRETRIYEIMRQVLSDKRNNEIKAGTTLYGPQRDDLLFTWDKGALIKPQASLGQAKALSLALRLAEWDLLYERSSQGKPLFLMDDLHSFLDEKIAEAFLDVASLHLGQVIITSHRSLEKSKFLDLHEIHIKNGKLI